VCKLKKSLYGLKKTACTWYLSVDEYLLKLGFTKNATDPNLYYIYEKSNLLVLVLYVDDLILIDNFNKLITWCKKKLASEYYMNFCLYRFVRV